MPGLRRFLDVASKISGALAEPRGQGDQGAPAEAVGAGSPPPDSGEPQAPAGDPQPVAAAEPQPLVEDAVPTAQLDQAPATAQAGPAQNPPPDSGSGPGVPQAEPVLPDRPDPACAAAVEPARAAAVEAGGDAVGAHLGAAAEPAFPGEHVVTHSFAATQPGYRGWRWAVTVARVDGVDRVTVDEVVLLPGDGAVLAPAWVPWADRLRPDDLGPGDLLPPPPGDVRLVPSYEDVTAPRLPADLHRDLGLGRPRVLSREGRDDAAERWFDGPAGPGTAMARNAPGRCASCGFLVLLAGDLGLGFGVCANGVAPDDGTVVALLHGCGAHSETAATSAHASTTQLAVEHEELELVDVAALPEPAADRPTGADEPA